MSIILAPMEGLLDFTLRDALTQVGGISRCVSEFIRVTNTLLPQKVFYRVVPELYHQGLTPAGVPVRPQLLGSDATCLAENAALLAQISPYGVDLNFGCPAKVVNRHGGGAALLLDPEHIYKIVAAVVGAVPRGITVSAKMRLGFLDDALAEDCARAIQAGGAQELVVHARTKQQGYRPPAYWDRIADIRAVVDIPMIANGDIWCAEDARRCQQASGCSDLMVGRGLVRNPWLARDILLNNGKLAHSSTNTVSWQEVLVLLSYFWSTIKNHIDIKSQAGRLKRWLHHLQNHFPHAQIAYQEIAKITNPTHIDEWFGAATIK